MALSLGTVVSQSPAAVSAEVAGEIVIMLNNGKGHFALDPVGSDVWVRLRTPRSIGALCDELMREYDTPRERLEEDVLALLASLLDVGAVEAEA